MVLTSKDELTKDRILELFKKLDNKMFANGVEANIYVVGGAAIALTLSDERVTTDIDGSFDNPALFPLIAQLAREEELTNNWLNESFKTILSYFKKDEEPKTVFTGNNLVIMVASPRFVLALKLAAMREKDIDDVVLLVNKLGIKTKDELLGAVKGYFNAELTAGAYQRQKIESFIDQILEEGQLQFPND